MIAILLSPDDAEVRCFEVDRVQPYIEAASIRSLIQYSSEPDSFALPVRRTRWMFQGAESELMSIAHGHRVLVYRQEIP